MPKGSKVHKVYEALLKEGFAKKNAVRIAQWRTKKSLKTGRTPKRKK